MKLTLSQAAKEAGISKSTLSRAIENGRVSAAKDDLGRYMIDHAELFRVFSAERHRNARKEQSEHGVTASGTGLEQEIQRLKEILTLMKVREEDLLNQRERLLDQVDRWQQQADDWKEQARSIQKITDHRRRGLLGFLKAG